MADRLDDLICTFHPGASAMETLAILLLGWIIFGAILTIVGRFLYSKLLDVPKEAPDPTATPPPLSLPAATPKDDKPVVSNTERFINDLKTKPPPTLPRVSRSRSSSTARSVDRGVSQIPESSGSQASGFPIITGSNVDCVKWVTGALGWLFKHPLVLNDLTGLWKDKLNFLTKKSEVESGVCVELDQIIFTEENPPSLTNVFCEITPFNERATLTSDFESRFSIKVRARRDRRDQQEVSEYKLQVDRFRGRINFSIDFRDLSSHAKFDGWPEVRLRVVQDKAKEGESAETESVSAPNDEELLMDVVVEMVTSALRAGTLTLKWSRYSDFPKFVSQKQVEPILPVHYDSMLEGGTRLISVGKEKKLLVKVIKANNLGSNKGCHEVHCIIEMDEPPQRHQTTSKKDTDSPFWDENFLFDLGSRTEEILFELYDRSDKHDTFLGLGIVGMEELLMNPSQRQIIPLQARPYENDPISGTLTLEFLFIDPKDIQGLPGGMSIATNISRDEVRMSRRDSYKRATKRSVNSTPLLSSHMVTGRLALENALKPLKEIEQQQLQPQPQQQQPPQPMPRRGNNRNSVINPYAQRPSDMEPVGAAESKDASNVSEGGDLPSGMGSVASSLSSRGDESTDRVRNRGPKRFFRSIKDRISRSKNRSRSVDPDQVREDSLSRDGVRSVSADRARSGRFLMVPGLTSATGDVGSARSSLSEVSATSNTSNRTYLDEASTLVLEALENDIKKYYLIPMALADKRQWKKKGTKLHIFSDHIFVARHLPGGSACQVCGHPMARRPGKQGYECRDCLLRCHKPCHVKVDTLCPNSTVHFMDLEFVEDTSAERKVRRN